VDQVQREHNFAKVLYRPAVEELVRHGSIVSENQADYEHRAADGLHLRLGLRNKFFRNYGCLESQATRHQEKGDQAYQYPEDIGDSHPGLRQTQRVRRKHTRMIRREARIAGVGDDNFSTSGSAEES
jgi:hypothetical protein